MNLLFYYLQNIFLCFIDTCSNVNLERFPKKKNFGEKGSEF